MVHHLLLLASAPQAWSLLALFVTMVSGLVLAPLPTGAWAFLGATAGLLTHTLTFEQMFAAANNTVMWLVVVSFFLARVSTAQCWLPRQLSDYLMLQCTSMAVCALSRSLQHQAALC